MGNVILSSRATESINKLKSEGEENERCVTAACGWLNQVCLSLLCKQTLTMYHVTGNSCRHISSSENKTLSLWLHFSHKTACVCFYSYWIEWPSWRSVIPRAIPSPTWDLQGWERGIRSTTEAPDTGYCNSESTSWNWRRMKQTHTQTEPSQVGYSLEVLLTPNINSRLGIHYTAEWLISEILVKQLLKLSES